MDQSQGADRNLKYPMVLIEGEFIFFYELVAKEFGAGELTFAGAGCFCDDSG